MDAIKRLWIAFQVFVLTGGVYGGTTNETVEQYFDEIIVHLYDKVEGMIPEPVMMQNIDIFLNESAIPRTITRFSLGRFSGLGTTFNRTGRCFVREKESESKVTCEVGFTNLQTTLPKNKDAKYVLLINTSGLLVISVPKDERNVTVSLMTLSSVNFTMQVVGLNEDARGSEQTRYIPNEEIPTDIKTTYRLVFQKFITQDKFKNALEAVFSAFPRVHLKTTRKQQKKNI